MMATLAHSVLVVIFRHAGLRGLYLLSHKLNGVARDVAPDVLLDSPISPEILADFVNYVVPARRVDRIVRAAGRDLLLMNELEFRKLVSLQLILAHLRRNKASPYSVRMEEVFMLLVKCIGRQLSLEHPVVLRAVVLLEQQHFPRLCDWEVGCFIDSLHHVWRLSCLGRLTLRSVIALFAASPMQHLLWRTVSISDASLFALFGASPMLRHGDL